MTVTPMGRDQDCSLKNREPDGPAPWFLDPRGWSKTAAVRLFFIFPGICTLSLGAQEDTGAMPYEKTAIVTHFSKKLYVIRYKPFTEGHFYFVS
ncbi:hypothetical protein STEG23_014332 [Scotinomys teguina]